MMVDVYVNFRKLSFVAGAVTIGPFIAAECITRDPKSGTMRYDPETFTVKTHWKFGIGRVVVRR